MTGARRRAGGHASAVAALLAVPWLLVGAGWSGLFHPSRGVAIAWLGLTAIIGAVLALGGIARLRAERFRVALWIGWLSLLCGMGMIGLAIAMLPIAFESTWAV